MVRVVVHWVILHPQTHKKVLQCSKVQKYLRKVVKNRSQIIYKSPKQSQPKKQHLSDLYAETC